jgi:two-component system NtrC family sensor kinase
VSFFPTQRILIEPQEEEIRKILVKTNKLKPEDELNCGACGYSSYREKAIAVYRGTAELEMCLPYLIDKIEKTVENLRENQTRLIQAEKLASMGQMATGIAHEINNPLGVVLMYSHLLKEELESGSQRVEDVDRIIHEAERTRKIVKGILNFAREEKIDRPPTDINELIHSSLEGILSSFPGIEYSIRLDFDPSLGPEEIDKNQIRQVFDNIIKNACEAMPEGGTINIKTKKTDKGFSVTSADTGSGISYEKYVKALFTLFLHKACGKGDRPWSPRVLWNREDAWRKYRSGKQSGRGNIFHYKNKKSCCCRKMTAFLR